MHARYCRRAFVLRAFDGSRFCRRAFVLRAKDFPFSVILSERLAYFKHKTVKSLNVFTYFKFVKLS